MNVLMVGAGGKAGSWAIRGVQLGAALGARVTSQPTDEDFGWAEVVVLVKRAGVQWADTVHRHGKPLVWDALDCWRQPLENSASEWESKRILAGLLATVRPTVTIGATQAMASACHGVYLPHHSWAGLMPTPAREHVQIVGYDGNPIYLGSWRTAIQQACDVRGWTFIVNPPDLATADILVAFRDGQWDGWMPREWKSGVKAVNAIAAGRPLLTQASAACLELQPSGLQVETVPQLQVAFDAWAPLRARQHVVAQCREQAQAFRLDSVAARYRQILQSVCVPCPA